MKYLTRTDLHEIVATLTATSFQALTTSVMQRPAPNMVYDLPREASRLAALGKIIASFVCFENSPVIWITETLVSSSLEDLDLLRGYIRGTGESRNESQVPAVVFGDGDTDAFLSIVRLALFFSWDAKIFESKSDRVILEISHEEILSIWTNKNTEATLLEEKSHLLALKKINHGR